MVLDCSDQSPDLSSTEEEGGGGYGGWDAVVDVSGSSDSYCKQVACNQICIYVLFISVNTFAYLVYLQIFEINLLKLF